MSDVCTSSEWLMIAKKKVQNCTARRKATHLRCFLECGFKIVEPTVIRLHIGQLYLGSQLVCPAKYQARHDVSEHEHIDELCTHLESKSPNACCPGLTRLRSLSNCTQKTTYEFKNMRVQMEARTMRSFPRKHFDLPSLARRIESLSSRAFARSSAEVYLYMVREQPHIAIYVI
jgi:hypothetical protein